MVTCCFFLVLAFLVDLVTRTEQAITRGLWLCRFASLVVFLVLVSKLIVVDSASDVCPMHRPVLLPCVALLYFLLLFVY